MGFLNLEGLERFWSHIVAFVGEKIDSLNLKNGTGYKAIKQVGANDATGTNAAAFGNNTKATGNAAMATGYATEANGDYSSASGIMTKANGAYGSVIGKYNETPDNAGYYVAKGTLWTTYENDTTYTRAIGTPTADLTNGKWTYEGTEQVLGSELQVGDIVQPSNYNYTELIGLKETTDTGRTFNWDRYRIENYNTKQSTYAFTVGNGNSNTARSNAHTLDWNGNAWFAGNVSVGENKVPLATENFVIEKDDLVVTISIDGTGTIISDKTYEEIAIAIEAGRDVFAKAIDNGFGYYLPLYVILEEAFIFGLNLSNGILMLGVDSSNTWIQEIESISMEPLTFTGAVEATYNGSAPITIEIPENNLQNLVDGTAEGSVRGITAAEEDDSYTLGKNAFAFGEQAKAEGNSSIAIHGWAKDGIAINVNGGWYSRTLTGEANATTYTYNWNLGDNTVTPGCYLSLDKEKLIKVISTDNEYLTVEETLSSTPLDNATVYVWQGVANSSIGIGGQAYDGGISIGGSACGHGAVGVGGGEATNYYSFAQGVYSEAKGKYSSAMGFHTKTTGHASHAEGYSTYASGTGAHSEGSSTSAIGTASHAEGSGTVAAGDYSHVQGQYNIEDTNNKYAHIVGNGEAEERSNAHTLDWSGNAWFAGEVKVGGTSQDNAASTLVGATNAATPYNWLATDADGNAIWEEKTHYSRGMATEILAEETEISITNDGETEGPILNTPMVPGETYEIILNGTSYNCKASTVYAPMGDNGEMAPCIVFGDFSIFEGNDYVSVVDMSASNPDVPFTSMIYPASLTGLAGDLVFLQILDDTLYNTTATFAIKHTYEDIEKLPYKYIYTPDQNAKETENGYIKNRTHWVEQDDNAIVMAETTLTDTGDGFMVSTPWVNNIIAGNTYTIIYNGVSYTSPAVDLSTQIDLPGATMLGDASMFGNDFTGGNPDAPFGIMCVPNAYVSNVGFSAVMADKNGLTEITIAIFGTGEKVHKLDSKFIDWPDWYPEIIAEDANTYSGSVTSTQFGDNYQGTFGYFEPADGRIYAIRLNNSTTTVDCVCEYYPGDIDLSAFYSFSNFTGTTAFQIQCYIDSAKGSAIISTFPVTEISFENPRQIATPISRALVEGTLKGFRNGKDSNGRTNYSVYGIGANSTLGNASLAVGSYASANGAYSIAYGEYCQANGLSSAAFNNGKAKVSYAFAANASIASGLRSASFNYGNAAGEASVSFNTSSASGKNQLTFGKSNIEDTESKYIMIAGNGDDAGGPKSNAATIAWDGTAWFKGDIKVGGTGQDDENATTLATQAYVDTTVSNINISSITAARINEICGTNIQLAEEVTY